MSTSNSASERAAIEEKELEDRKKAIELSEKIKAGAKANTSKPELNSLSAIDRGLNSAPGLDADHRQKFEEFQAREASREKEAIDEKQQYEKTRDRDFEPHSDDAKIDDLKDRLNTVPGGQSFNPVAYSKAKDELNEARRTYAGNDPDKKIESAQVREADFKAKQADLEKKISSHSGSFIERDKLKKDLDTLKVDREANNKSLKEMEDTRQAKYEAQRAATPDNTTAKPSASVQTSAAADRPAAQDSNAQDSLLKSKLDAIKQIKAVVSQDATKPAPVAAAAQERAKIDQTTSSQATPSQAPTISERAKHAQADSASRQGNQSKTAGHEAFDSANAQRRSDQAEKNMQTHGSPEAQLKMQNSAENSAALKSKLEQKIEQRQQLEASKAQTQTQTQDPKNPGLGLN